ncbi:MAG: cobyrinate a,c-diamide synthase [Victivallales bacterium]|jgi:cobyrinic acid a,c-diamide synthase
MSTKLHAFCIAGTNSGAGKTTITIALLRALKRRGIKVAPFKCGPDYIDTAFHRAACGSPSRNLDSWMVPSGLSRSFEAGIEGKDCAVIEGVMGLFDGAKPGRLEGSTADVARSLNVPVLLVVNARGMAGSISALVKGYCTYRPEIKIIGVIANNVSSERHAEILRTSLKKDRLPPLLGWLPRDEKLKLPERHLGLVPVFENRKTGEWFDRLADVCEKHIEIDRILKVSGVRCQVSGAGGQKKDDRRRMAEDRRQRTRLRLKTTPWQAGDRRQKTAKTTKLLINHPVIQSSIHPIRIGIAYDDAFNFYYEDNFDALRNAGFEIVFFSPLHDKALPEGIKFLYIGGGFPEVFAGRLSKNKSMLRSVSDFAASGAPVFAECGGFMYLSETISCGGIKYNMSGVIPCRIKMESKLHSLGYREIKLRQSSFLGKRGTLLRGHEFHWSSAEFTSENITPAFEARGTRKNSKWMPAGIKINNVIASYIHIHFLSNPSITINIFKSLQKRLLF